jgi:hypothetical protein
VRGASVRRWKSGPRRASLGRAFAASVLVVLAFPSREASAAPPQVNVYVNNYGAAAQQAAQQVSPPPSIPTPAQVSGAGAGGVTPAEATLAQVAAYQQYLLYLNVANSQPRASGANAAQYFNNGAAVTSVPSAGQPGAAYFSNGASATSVPSAGQPGAAYFANGAEATRLPSVPAAAPYASPAPSASAPLPPGWWTEPATPPAKTAPSSSPPSAPPPAAVAATMQEPAMSFQEWLRTMGATAPQTQAPETPEPPEAPALAALEEEAPPVAELSTTANDVRQRASYPVRAREKSRERVAKRAPGPLGIIAGAFAVGILLGAVVMRRARVALEHAGNATPGR